VSAPLPDSRGPLRSLLDAWVFDKKVPAGCGFLRALGTALLVVLVAQGVTGMFLALAYVPSPDHAYEAIRSIDDDYSGGRLLRGLHHWGASAVMVLAFLHLARVYFTGAYKRPRQLLWVVGVARFGVLVGFGFTGYLLPWDMKAFWATDVGLNIVGSLPLVGGPLADLLRGGPEIGAPTLARMFALHVLFLPAILLPLAGLHLLLVHLLDITPPGARVGEPSEERAVLPRPRREGAAGTALARGRRRPGVEARPATRGAGEPRRGGLPAASVSTSSACSAAQALRRACDDRQDGAPARPVAASWPSCRGSTATRNGRRRRPVAIAAGCC
jgi:hypothetical protein